MPKCYSVNLGGNDVRKESIAKDDYIYKFSNNYHLAKISQQVNIITSAIDKNKKDFRNTISFDFDNKAVQFKINNDYKMLEIYIGKEI